MADTSNMKTDVTPKPLSMNPKTDEKAKRHLARVARLRAAIAAGNTKDSMKRELAEREAWLTRRGLL